MPDPRADFIADITEPVYLSVGEASACWENLAGAGVFDSDHAKKVAERLVERVVEAFDKHGDRAAS
jgi:hypothetical protein